MKSVPFSEAFRDLTSKYSKIPKSKFLESGSFPIIDQGRGKIAGYFDDVASAVDNGEVVIFGDHTRAVKFADGPFALGADGTKVLKPVFGLFPRYAYRWLEAQEVTSLGYSRHFKLLKELSVPVCHEEEQRRIADILDKADVLRAKRREAIAHLESLGQSIFHEMFGDPVTNSRGWSVQPLSRIGTLDRGVSKHRPRNDPKLLGGDVPLIQTGDVAKAYGYVRAYKTTYSDLGLSQSKLWPAGTLCITIAANIAKTAILTFDACFPDSVVGFTAPQARIEFVRQWFGFLQAIIERRAPESAQKNINLAILRNLEVIDPPFELQEEFTLRVAIVEKLKSKHRAQLAELDNLFLSLQDRAFKGEL